MSKLQKRAEANLEHLRRIFTVPEAPDSTLARLEAEISRNLHGFLNQRIVATQRKLNVRGMEITVEGELDGEVLMGKSTANRTGFQGLTLTVDVDADMTREEKEEFLHEVDRRCPVSENLLNATPITLHVR